MFLFVLSELRLEFALISPGAVEEWWNSPGPAHLSSNLIRVIKIGSMVLCCSVNGLNPILRLALERL